MNFSLFQILAGNSFTSNLIDLMNSSFALVGKLYGYMIDLATTTHSRTLVEYIQGLVNSFYIIAGLFMLFRISISVFEYILDPDKMSDSKTSPSKLLTNIFITVLLLIAFQPGGVVYTFLNDVEDTFLYSQKVNKDGSKSVVDDKSGGFFGRLFSNIGTANTDSNSDSDSNKSSSDSKKNESAASTLTSNSTERSGNNNPVVRDSSGIVSDEGKNSENYFHGLTDNELFFANSVAGSFYSCNLGRSSNESKTEKDKHNKDRNEVYNSYLANINEYVKSASKKKANPILSLTSSILFIGSAPVKLVNWAIGKLTVDDKACYAFEISPLTINDAGTTGEQLVKDGKLDYYFFTGIVFSILLMAYLLVLCVEVIVRNLKIILYQAIAPIPIINGIDPNDKMRTAWFKGYFGAYFDLFVKVFAIQMLAKLIIFIPKIGEKVGFFGTLFFLVALLVFVKIVPNIISDVLGIKNLGGSFNEVKGMAKKALGVGAAASGMVLGAGIGGVVGAMTTNGGRGAKAFSALRGAVAGGQSGRKKDIFKGGQTIAKTNAMENDLRDEGVGAFERMFFGRYGKAGMPSAYSKQKKKLDLEEVDLQNQEAEITAQKALLREDEYKKGQNSELASLADESKKSGSDDLKKNKEQHRGLFEVQAYNELLRRLDAKKARGEEITKDEQFALSEAQKYAGDAIAEFDAKSSFYDGKKFERKGKRLVEHDDGTFDWVVEDQTVTGKRDIGAYNRMMHINAIRAEQGLDEFNEYNIGDLDLGKIKDDAKLEVGRLERSLDARKRNITVQEEKLGDDKQDLANRRRALENSREKLIHDAYHNNGS